MGTVIFDLDGTLADTSGDLIAAANSFFAERGAPAPLDPSKDAAVALLGGRAMLRLGHERLGTGGAPEADAGYARFLEHYARDINRHTRLYPGVEDAIAALKSAGHRVAICTNKPERLAEQLMTRLGARDLFGGLVGADTLPVRKPDPAPYVEAVRRAGGEVAQSLLVGDSVTDRDTARAAGVPIILVTFGPAGGDMAALAPDALLSGYGDLPALVDDLLA